MGQIITDGYAELKSLLAALTPVQRSDFVSKLTDEQAIAMQYDWPLWARANQLQPPDDALGTGVVWSGWLILAGRGFGKTRIGAETIIQWAKTKSARRIALVAEDAADGREVMVEGPAGIVACSPPWFKPVYEPSKRRVLWPNGVMATIYSSQDYEALRGPQHDGAWVDELAKYRYQTEVWDNLMFGLRLGQQPRVIVTTTPRPTKLIKQLLKDKAFIVTRGSTYENLNNLAPIFQQQIIAKYEGTRMGRQELLAEVITEVAGAMWTYEMLDKLRVKEPPKQLQRIVVALDPATTSGEESDDTGLTVSGIAKHEGKLHGYVLADESMKGTPIEWAKRAVYLYKKFRADAIVAEVNNGGDMIETTIHTVDPNVRVKKVHATRGKVVRAEPVSALYEQGRVHHCGTFPLMEDQLCEMTQAGFQGTGSPDRADSLVWGITDLMLDSGFVDYAALNRM